MNHALKYIAVIAVITISFSACVSEKDKQDMREMLKESLSNSSSSVKESASSKSESIAEREQSESESIEKPESGSTVIDNKQPSQSGGKDGITIHIPQSDIDKFNSELSELREEMKEFSFNEITDYEYSEPTEWRERAESKRDETAGWMNEE